MNKTNMTMITIVAVLSVGLVGVAGALVSDAFAAATTGTAGTTGINAGAASYSANGLFGTGFSSSSSGKTDSVIISLTTGSNSFKYFERQCSVSVAVSL